MTVPHLTFSFVLSLPRKEKYPVMTHPMNQICFADRPHPPYYVMKNLKYTHRKIIDLLVNVEWERRRSEMTFDILCIFVSNAKPETFTRRFRSCRRLIDSLFFSLTDKNNNTQATKQSVETLCFSSTGKIWIIQEKDSMCVWVCVWNEKQASVRRCFNPLVWVWVCRRRSCVISMLPIWHASNGRTTQRAGQRWE